MEKILWNHIQTVRQQSPLVHNITNFVVMNNTANALLAAGASPIMAHAHKEVASMVGICQSLVVNIGTLDDYFVESMLMAAATAHQMNKPWVLDPVGAGATTYRDEIIHQLLTLQPTVVRGNASEILALAKANTTITKGVDSTAASNEAVEAAISIHENYGTVVCISGAIDIIVTNKPVAHIHNGDIMMTRVTGLGCSASALIGAFIAVITNTTEAVTAATALMGICGELAAQKSKGPGSLQMHLLDELHSISPAAFNNTLRITQHG